MGDSPPPSGLPPPLVLSVERLSRRLADRWTRPLRAERFAVRPSLDDLPLYVAARAVLRRTGAIRARTWVQRMVEPPVGLGTRMEQKVPQFFLRNVLRAERDPSEEVAFAVVATRDREGERQLRDLRSLRYRRPALLTRWNLDDVVWLRQMLRTLLFREDWRRRFGRELKETVRGPLFRYDPDRPADPDEPVPASVRGGS